MTGSSNTDFLVTTSHRDSETQRFLLGVEADLYVRRHPYSHSRCPILTEDADDSWNLSRRLARGAKRGDADHVVRWAVGRSNAGQQRGLSRQRVARPWRGCTEGNARALR